MGRNGKTPSGRMETRKLIETRASKSQKHHALLQNSRELTSFVLETLVAGFVLETLVGGFVLETLVGGFVLETLVGGFVLETLVGGFVLETKATSSLGETVVLISQPDAEEEGSSCNSRCFCRIYCDIFKAKKIKKILDKRFSITAQSYTHKRTCEHSLYKKHSDYKMSRSQYEKLKPRRRSRLLRNNRFERLRAIQSASVCLGLYSLGENSKLWHVTDR
ncbi:hypothetical protein J6590_037412 [Homalodisca vitripennis]|nr:hypothetical protein J6590_037412 [Homalodisca vitripennis]